MRLNQERLVALIALVLCVVLGRDFVIGVLSPPGHVTSVDTALPSGQRQVVARKYRTFDGESVLTRDPYTFDEGWQPVEVPPLSAPPLPPPQRLILPPTGSAASDSEVEYFSGEDFVQLKKERKRS